MDAVKLSHDSAFLLAMCASDAGLILLDKKVQLKTEMEKAVSHAMVSLNIRKDSVAKTPPFPSEWRGNLKQAAWIALSTSS